MKNLKKILSIMFVAMFIFVSYGCKEKEKPSEKVEKYFSDIKTTTNFSGIIAGVISESEDNVSKELAEKMLDKLGETTYTINSESEDGDSAIVNVTINGMEFDVLMNTYLEEVVAYAFSQATDGNEMTEEEITKYCEDLLLEKLDNITFGDRTGDILLEKVDGKWQVVEDNSLIILLMNTDFSEYEN